MFYDYRDAMKDDVKDFIKCNINLDDYEDRDALEECLNDMLWTEDSVTGNGSGSYTFNREMAKGYVTDNIDLCKDAIEMFGIEGGTIADNFLNEDWEYFDVTIRCYLLGEIIGEVIDEMDFEF